VLFVSLVVEFFFPGGSVSGKRYLVVTADDFGIGLPTSQGILDLARQGVVRGTVLLANSPHAEAAVRLWRRAGMPVELGWHPCLTLDQPVLPAAQVPSLVGPDGRFWPLGSFLGRLQLGQIRTEEVEAEWRAQLQRFGDLVGHPPTVVNSHHHVQVFRPLGTILIRLLAACRPAPYVRRIREPWTTLLGVPGARCKRVLLSTVGRGDARAQRQAGFPGNEWLAGITDPSWVSDPDFLVRWLMRMPGKVVELLCHPGYEDSSLVGRDGTAQDGQVLRRVRELDLLRSSSFTTACRRAGFTLVAPTDLTRLVSRGDVYAA
jgi:predicted glycoside hydrolase/deacetylase ChbG (UPF0249 family)